MRIIAALAVTTGAVITVKNNALALARAAVVCFSACSSAPHTGAVPGII
ncbi:hypothetical protein [Shimwellia blattae]|nr:hypothetical protein [Shimwellia blattae]